MYYVFYIFWLRPCAAHQTTTATTDYSQHEKSCIYHHVVVTVGHKRDYYPLPFAIYIIWCRVHRCIHQRGHTWTLSLSLSAFRHHREYYYFSSPHRHRSICVVRGANESRSFSVTKANGKKVENQNTQFTLTVHCVLLSTSSGSVFHIFFSLLLWFLFRTTRRRIKAYCWNWTIYFVYYFHLILASLSGLRFVAWSISFSAVFAPLPVRWCRCRWVEEWERAPKRDEIKIIITFQRTINENRLKHLILCYFLPLFSLISRSFAFRRLVILLAVKGLYFVNSRFLLPIGFSESTFVVVHLFLLFSCTRYMRRTASTWPVRNWTDGDDGGGGGSGDCGQHNHYCGYNVHL